MAVQGETRAAQTQIRQAVRCRFCVVVNHLECREINDVMGNSLMCNSMIVLRAVDTVGLTAFDVKTSFYLSYG
jgi:hypothetical protein